jgi:hypothetical protein
MGLGAASKRADQLIGMRLRALDPDHQRMGRKRAQHLVLGVVGVHHLADRPAGIDDHVGIAVEVPRARDEAGRVQERVDLGPPVKVLPAHVFLEGQAALRGIPGLPRKVESGARFPKVMFDPI